MDERDKVIVTRFGQVIRSDEVPGLHFKVPFLDEAKYFDSRLLTLNLEPQQLLTMEKKYVVVDAFVKWRVVDTLKYYLTVGGQESEAQQRLQQAVNSNMRDEVAKHTAHDVFSTVRQKIMDNLTANADQEARKLGISVLDVRIQRVDLPDKVSQSVYQRMKAERMGIAKELRAEGAAAAEKIRADSDRQREIMLAEAYGKAELIRGEGDAKVTDLYGNAYGRAPGFFALYRSLNAYKESFKNKSDIMIIDPSLDFFKYMKQPGR
ncbi:MAG: protease modulator HflC [Sulfuricaulis sp.]